MSAHYKPTEYASSYGSSSYEPGGHEISDDVFVECRSCGYEPADTSKGPARQCPKCGGSAWRRVLRPTAVAVA